MLLFWKVALLFKILTVPMDQVLKIRSTNKPVKNRSSIIKISCRKEAVAKWNIIKQDKSKFATFLCELCSLDEEDEYSLHHKFSENCWYWYSLYLSCYWLHNESKKSVQAFPQQQHANIAHQTKVNRKSI